jgi:uncharacterized protein YdeI (YjbR/CyaY-like superfamily)
MMDTNACSTVHECEASVTQPKKPELNLPVKLFSDQAAWEKWLAAHHTSSPGLFLRIAKKSSDLQSVTYLEAVETALCYGWIDGLKKAYDEVSWLQKFTIRRPRSIWSKINRAKALKLIECGRMKTAGLAAIEGARKNGQWDGAYDSHRTAVPSEEFEAALDKHPKAKAFFATLNGQNRYSILMRIQTARKEETRRKRMDEFIRKLEQHEKIYP